MTTSDTTLFPPVLPRPKALASVTVDGTAVDKGGRARWRGWRCGVHLPVRGGLRTSSGRFVLSGVDANVPLLLRFG